ncbi:MAG: hypothetical protein ABFD92_02570 [Planctomycetaceae bacterium]|nr:hypothetical protein [Planctomycetaceae bacterium]
MTFVFNRTFGTVLACGLAALVGGWRVGLAKIESHEAYVAVTARSMAEAVASLHKGNTSWAVAAMIAAAVLGKIGFFTRQDLWDGRHDEAIISRQAAAAIAPDARVAGWDAVEGIVLYYFGRPVPDAQALKQTWVRRYGQDPGTRRWQQWLNESDPPLWLFAHQKSVPQLQAMGFAPAAGINYDPDSKEDIVIMRRPERNSAPDR